MLRVRIRRWRREGIKLLLSSREQRRYRPSCRSGVGLEGVPPLSIVRVERVINKLERSVEMEVNEAPSWTWDASKYRKSSSLKDCIRNICVNSGAKRIKVSFA